MKRLQKFGRCSYKDNARIKLNKLFSSEITSELNLKATLRKLSSPYKSMKSLQKIGRSSYKDNARITLNKLFSSEIISEINLKFNYQEIIITEQKYETFTKVREIQ